MARTRKAKGLMRPPRGMPPQVAKIHEPLSRSLWMLYAEWNDFKLLYCKDNKTVRLLDNVASFFFLIVSEVLRDHIILSVCRITDPKESRVRNVAKQNLTIAQLVAAVPATEVRFHRKLDRLVVNMGSACGPFREHRNRRIGHSDLDTRLRQAKVLLPRISLRDGDRALKSIAKVLNAVEHHFERNPQSYHHGTYGSGNGQHLIEYLEEAEWRRSRDSTDD